MKILLASLMCLVLGASQCFAHKGGPTYPAGTNLVGTYAGVLQGVFDPTNPASSNSIGVFSLGVPSTGNAHGSFIMFSRGRIFTGTTDAFADPNHGTLKGILDASFTYNISTLLTDATGAQHIDTVSVTATANGPINATVAQSQSASFFALATTILRGDATLSISQGGVAANGDPIITSVLSLTVSGVKQSDSVSLL